MKLKLRKNKKINQNDYNDINEYHFDKKTDVIPKKTNRLICIIFTEDKQAYILFRKTNFKSEIDYFRFKNGKYIIDNESIHITANNNRMAFYLEGISTPIKMSNIEKEQQTVEYTDLQGHKQKSIIQKIKGLKFDSKILDIFTNRQFAELFTKDPHKHDFQIYLLIIGIVSLVMIGITYGLIYYFK